MNTKKLLSVCAALLLAVTSFAQSGTCGAHLNWALTGTAPNFTLTISGTGTMSEYSYYSVPWYSYRSNITSLVIEDGITSIYYGAFINCNNLTGELIIPNSVTTIQDNAFDGCERLTSVSLSTSLTSIGAAAFFGCRGLTSITLVASLAYIEDGAFGDCSGLTSITSLAETPPALGEDVFENLTLSDITLTVPNSAVDAYRATAVWQDMNVVGVATGIADVQANNQLQVVVENGELRIENVETLHATSVVTIVDLQGRIVLSLQNSTATINISALPQGVYLVRVGNSVGKFIIHNL